MIVYWIKTQTERESVGPYGSSVMLPFTVYEVRARDTDDLTENSVTIDTFTQRLEAEDLLTVLRDAEGGS